MKRKILLYACIISVLLNLFVVGVFATGQQEIIKAILNKDLIMVWNADIFEPVDTETGERLYPLSYEGRTYVPVRAVAERAGMSVDWDERQHAVLFGANFNAETGKHYPDSTYIEKDPYNDCFTYGFCN